ncbi:E3 ubiquitin-protein ligase makorin-1 [Biomphalaria pfeifferi]|uniref:E3 ubiquitin-protein ligase makorin-1 n=1 Tax=Biomphalaria pfeifferi TaxID=112525 RepID=A0AAD8BZS5_BIOPF|nr:E3 ubiquitin-protein ligase makorin-1 [Biomphalaria pfeifferi]
MTVLRKLYELSCKQLKEELRARELRIFCDKEKMRASLRQNLVDEGEDPETHLFEVEPDIREVMSAVLKEINEQISTMIKQIGTITSLNKTNESFDTVMNKTDDQIATMSTGINKPLLNGDAVDDSVVYDCNSEPCKLGSYDKNTDICCDSAEHRSDHVIVIPACTLTLNKNCADGAASSGEYDHRKTCQQSLDQTDVCPDTSISKRLQLDLCK